MASIVTYSNGLRRIEYSLTPRGERRSVRLGRVSVKVAETWKVKIETIVADQLSARPHDGETAKWLGLLDETMLGRLRAGGLAVGVGLTNITLGEFLERIFSTMAGKVSTQTFYGHTKRNLLEYWSESRLMRDISTADADEWRAWLANSEKLSPATIARRVVAARTFWRKAVRWKLASENPFSGIKAGHQENEARKFFVTQEVTDQVIASVIDLEWKLIIALARYGGLRCPSEHFALKWAHVDWERSQFTIHSSKTEHHVGKATRVVPIFLELLPYLREAFEHAEPGTEYVIAKYRQGCLNLGQQFERILQRAGVTPWPRLFQNLRASRETELMRQYDLTTVCKWIGNSPAVAAKHYAMSMDLDGDFRRAAGLGDTLTKAQQNAQQSAATSDVPEKTNSVEPPENTEENVDLAHWGPSQEIADKTTGWAIRDSNP
ncbi:hypothetical protein BH10PLA1_BH10PLA1_16300 [soil metagenome]